LRRSIEFDPMSLAKATQPATERRSRRVATINIRVEPETRDLIDQAAAASGKSRSEFMVEVARKQAIDVLLDRRLFVLSEGDYDAFLAAVENPPPPGPALKALLKRRPPWAK